MSWTVDGDGRFIFVNDGVGDPQVPPGQTPNPNTGGGSSNTGGGAGTDMHPTMTAQSGFRWGGNMPGKGQFQDIPNTGPSDWRGVPFAQTDTAGRPLSSYYNMVDQYAASRADRNPLQAEGAFNRWNFGGPNSPPDPRWQGTHRGLLTGDPWRSPGPVNAAPLSTPGNGTGVGTGPGGLLGGTTPVPNPTPPPPQGGGGPAPTPVPTQPPGAPGAQPPGIPVPPLIGGGTTHAGGGWGNAGTPGNTITPPPSNNQPMPPGGEWNQWGLLDPRSGIPASPAATSGSATGGLLGASPQTLANYIARRNTAPTPKQLASFGAPASSYPGQITGVNTGASLNGETPLQYALRMGMAPNDASAYIASKMAAN